MKFRVIALDSITNGVLDYLPEDQAFSFAPRPNDGVTSLLINDLQIAINDQGRLLYCWGFCPQSGWEIRNLVPPILFHKGAVILSNAKKIIPGVSLKIADKNRWPIFVDLKSGWIAIGDFSVRNDESILIEFACGSLAELSERNELVSLWLKPRYLPF
jgi:hypothetical protein